MRPLAAIATREYAAFFRLPIGWVVIALYLLLAGAVFALGTLRPGAPATLRELFNLSAWLLMFVAPAISMRLISDELRQGSIEPLMTSPLSDWQVITGKYVGALLFLLTMLAPTILFAGALELLADPDYGPIAAGYLGLTLIGMLYLAAGLFFSACTSSQVVAFLATIFFLLLLRLATTSGAAALGEPLDRVLYALSPDLRLADFSRGVIDTSHVVVLLAMSAWFVTLAVVALESRRWR